MEGRALHASRLAPPELFCGGPRPPNLPKRKRSHEYRHLHRDVSTQDRRCGYDSLPSVGAAAEPGASGAPLWTTRGATNLCRGGDRRCRWTTAAVLPGATDQHSRSSHLGAAASVQARPGARGCTLLPRTIWAILCTSPRSPHPGLIPYPCAALRPSLWWRLR